MREKIIKGKVRSKTLCFVKNCLHQEGEEFYYEGPENGCLEEILPEKKNSGPPDDVNDFLK